jgi:hypothetical protein
MPRVVSSRQTYRTAARQYARDSVTLNVDRIRSWPVSECAPLRFADSCDGAAAAEACEDNEAGDSHDGSALAYVASGSKDRFVLARVARTISSIAVRHRCDSRSGDLAGTILLVPPRRDGAAKIG